ncbi:MAG: metallophosphoesterase [Nanoarchaeota archaeon]
MQIHTGIEIIDLALKYKDNLIIGDIQLGHEESLQREGFFIPKFNLQEIIKRLDKIFSQVKVRRIIVNGDIKHEFGSILRQEWKDILAFFDYLFTKVEEIILIKGNHDIILGPLANKKNIKIYDYLNIDNLTILHGHKVIPDLRSIIIIGHEHPAISFKEKKYERFKCFLKGNWHDKILIVMPSFNFLTEGSDITKEGFLSPFLKDNNLDEFEVYVVEDKVYKFGKLREIIN